MIFIGCIILILGICFLVLTQISKKIKFNREVDRLKRLNRRRQELDLLSILQQRLHKEKASTANGSNTIKIAERIRQMQQTGNKGAKSQ